MVRVTDSIYDDENGQSAAEYSLILSLVFVVVVAAVGLLGDNIVAFFNHVVDIWPA